MFVDWLDKVHARRWRGRHFLTALTAIRCSIPLSLSLQITPTFRSCWDRAGLIRVYVKELIFLLFGNKFYAISLK